MSVNTVGSATRGALGPVVVNRVELAPPPLKLYKVPIALVVLAFLSLPDALVGNFTAIIRFVLFAGSGTALLVRRARLRCGLTLHEEGVVISRKGVDEVIAYKEVRDFSLQETSKLTQGKQAGVLRTLVFTSAEGKRRIAQFTATGAQDTLASILPELLNRLADAAEARLKKGVPLEGKGWKVHSHVLHVAGQQPVRLGDLGGVGMDETRVSLWRDGEERPFFSVAAASPNARLLGVVSGRYLVGRKPAPMAGTLGRLLFQRKMEPLREFLCWGTAGLFLLAGVGLPVMGLVERSWDQVLLSLGGFWGVAALFVYPTFDRLLVYEEGITERSFFHSHTLRYSEIMSFRFRMTRNYSGLFYAGASVSMRFTTGRRALEDIQYSQNLRVFDADLDGLCEHVARMMARQLLERLERGDMVRWGPTAMFTKDGLLIQNAKLRLPATERRILYDEKLRFHFEEGTFHLFIGAEERAAMTVERASDTDNFYPGLHLLGMLSSREVNAPRLAG